MDRNGDVYLSGISAIPRSVARVTGAGVYPALHRCRLGRDHVWGRGQRFKREDRVDPCQMARKRLVSL